MALSNHRILVVVILLLAFEQGASQITPEEVELHAKETDCWSTIYGKVYDLTAYASTHPGNKGGNATVLLLCGNEGTSLYDTFHGNNPQYLDTLARIIFKGDMVTSSPTEQPTSSPTTAKPTTQAPTDVPTTISPTTMHPTISPEPTYSPTETTHLTLAMVAPHNHPKDCWTSIYGKVYDLTVYAPTHPGNGGGSEIVYLLCGIDGSALYDTFHGNNPQYLQELPEIVFRGITVTMLPTEPPTMNPTSKPTTAVPTTSTPTDVPSFSPSLAPSLVRTVAASGRPSLVPSLTPSHVPSWEPSVAPSVGSSVAVNGHPSIEPSMPPSGLPTEALSLLPSYDPTVDPSNAPTVTACEGPSVSPTTLAPTISPHPTFSPTTTNHLTLNMVSLHSHPKDCWSSIYGKVYDLTAYAPTHPGNGGGSETVYLLCGIEGSSLYDSFHGNNPQYLQQLPEIIFKGTTVNFLPTEPPTKSPSTTPTTVAPSTLDPTGLPSVSPSFAPSNTPSSDPSFGPTGSPTPEGSTIPSALPSASPSTTPSVTPSSNPSAIPTTAQPTISAWPTVVPTITTYLTKEDVAKHAAPEDCWSSVYGKVYDLTVYAPNHPRNGGGSETVYLMCGVDGSSLFESFHRNNPQYLQLSGIEFMGVAVGAMSFESPTALPTTEIPTAVPTSPSGNPTPMPTDDNKLTQAQFQQTTSTNSILFSPEELALHSTDADCWVSYFDEVFDVTSYAPTHPAGAALVTQNCGEDGTSSYGVFHTYDELGEIHHLFKGYLGRSQSPQPSPAPVPFPVLTPLYIPESGESVIVPLSEMGQHTSADNCWVAYFGEVFDVTKYAPNHPAGAALVTQNCGHDDTESYSLFHTYEELEEIRHLFKGYLGNGTESQTPYTSTTTPVPTEPPLPAAPQALESSPAPVLFPAVETKPTSLIESAESPIVSAEMALHNTPQDCWVSYYGEVFDVTDYAPTHPGGASIVTTNCGHDDTESYSLFHTYEELEEIRPSFQGMLQTMVDESEQAGDEGSESSPPPVSTTDVPILDNGMVHFSSLQQHSTPDDCWVSYYGEVYDMTRYAPEHPAGSESITADCGKDGTEGYKIFHERSLLALVQHDYLGDLDTTTVAVAATDASWLEPTALTMEEIASHDNPGSCWVRYFNDVYDLTYYSHPSPPGQSVIYLGCGRDSTPDFASAHPRNLLEDVEEHKIGWIESSAARTIVDLTYLFIMAALLFFWIV